MLTNVLTKLHLLRSSKRDLVILDNISGVIPPRRLTLLLGPPSAGKTTLLKALAAKLHGVKVGMLPSPCHCRSAAAQLVRELRCGLTPLSSRACSQTPALAWQLRLQQPELQMLHPAGRSGDGQHHVQRRGPARRHLPVRSHRLLRGTGTDLCKITDERSILTLFQLHDARVQLSGSQDRNCRVWRTLSLNMDVIGISAAAARLSMSCQATF